MSTDRARGREGAKLGAPARDPEPGPGGAQVPAQPVRPPGQGQVKGSVRPPGQGQVKGSVRAPVQGHAEVRLQKQAEDLPDQGCSVGMAAAITRVKTVNGAVKADHHRGADGAAGPVRLEEADLVVVDAAVVGDARPAVNEQKIAST